MATPERLIATLQAYQQTEALRAAIDLDVFTAIAAGATDLRALAKRCSVSVRGLRALTNYLVTLGYLELEGGAYRLAPDAARFLDRRVATYLGGTADFYAAPLLRAGFRSVADAVRRGGSDPQKVDSMAPRNPVWLEYARGMAPLFVPPAAAVASLLEEQGIAPRRVLDLAAGHGWFGLEIARRFPDAEVTAADWPAVLAVARDHARTAGVAARFRTLPGDVFSVPLGRGYDVIVVANFLHHFAPARIRRLLRRLRASLAESGRLVLVEFVPNDDRVTPPSVAQFGLRLLATTPHGDIYTFAEFAELLKAAGFAGARLYPVAGSPERAILAERAAPAGRKSAL